jgi:signal transduction histidine kinase
VNSEISSAQYPLELFVWDSLNIPAARLSLSRITTEPRLLLTAVEAARESGLVVQQEVRFIKGATMLIAAPHADGWVTTALLAPRTRIVRDEPFLSLFGLTQGMTPEPPYTITLTPLESRPQSATASPRWQRRDDALHGDVDLPDYSSGVHAHLEVDLRSFEVLFQRGTLVLLLDVVIFVCLWALVVAADGSLSRWLRTRRHLFANSYRVRLTLALFGFFIVPAAVFAFWSQRGIIAGDRQARELLVTEMLRAAESEALSGSLAAASERLDAPLFLYDRGRLVAASDTLFLQLAPLGRRLPPRVFSSLDLGDEMSASLVQQVGPARALVGYRIASGTSQRRSVLAAPARADNLAIDRRRRDLGVLLMFTTAVGALAAMVLSGVAARQLARPIGILRGAALAIARGEREPSLPEDPRSEFETVFTAFRAMAADLSTSRGQLVAAQRRIEAILRNVASGVIAFDGQGRVTLANPRSGTLLGMRLEPGMTLHHSSLSALDKHVAEFLSGRDDEQEFDQEIGGRQMHGWLTRLSSGDGGAVLTLDDVSEMARAQRVIAWGQMARQVAHEIKNPLTPIRLGVQHLRRAHTDQRADYDRILDANVARILEEIDRLDEIARTFSRYGLAPAQRSSAAPVDVGDIARDVVALERMGEGDVEWRYEESEASLIALASEDELREVLLNLLENARHAGAGVVTMSVNRRATTVVVEVVDDGHGIPADVLPRIFEPHFSTRSSGSGLGLAISRKMIEGWGGEISVGSEEGKGARVTILLLAPLEL